MLRLCLLKGWVVKEGWPRGVLGEGLGVQGLGWVEQARTATCPWVAYIANMRQCQCTHSHPHNKSGLNSVDSHRGTAGLRPDRWLGDQGEQGERVGVELR